MDELKEIQPSGATITLGGQIFKVRFGYKAWAKIQEKYGGITELGKRMAENPPETILTLLNVCIRRSPGDPEISESQLVDWLDEYDVVGIRDIMGKLMKAVTGSLPTPKPGQGEEVPTIAK